MMKKSICQKRYFAKAAEPNDRFCRFLRPIWTKIVNVICAMIEIQNNPIYSIRQPFKF